MRQFTLEDLNAIIKTRAGETPDSSYTASLLAKGAEKCARKFGEESIEAIVAALSDDSEELTKEAADVLYHLLVLLESRGVDLSDVMAELGRRTAQSGHAEKASR
ncbi:MAG: phosphoribosyl-ATP diphosphatase [Pseudomonadota bacterium]